MPTSVVLVGIRDVREYKAEIKKGRPSMETASPFNIKSDSMVLKNFLKKEVYSLLEQHTAETWLDRYTYKESAHHLLLMAFLQRLVNSGGEIIREMAVGNGRIDLLVKFHKQRVAMELKIKRGKKSIEKAKKQLDRYLDRLGLNEGYLVIFDPGEGDWETRLYMKEEVYNQKKIIMAGC